MAGFYLREDGCTIGPFDEATLRQRLSDRALAWSTMSWRAGEARWTSLGRRWMKRGAGPLLVAACGWLLGVGLATLAVVAMVQGVDLPESLRGFAARLGIVAVADVLAVALAAWYWKEATRRTGWPTLGAVSCALLVGTGVACSLAAIGLQKRISDNRASMPDARMVFDRTSGELHIDGNVGSHFTRDLRAALDRASGLQRVVIDSPGGLLEDALEAGALLGERGVTVRVTQQCASACSVLWASASRREIAFEGRIGLHRSWIDVELPSTWRAYNDGDFAARTGVVMKRAGFNDAMLARQAKTAPGDMYWLDPMEMYEGGVQLVIIGADGKPLSGSRAKFLAVASDLEPAAPFRKLMEAYVARLPQRADRLGPDLYAALRSGDRARMFSLSSQFSADAKAYALGKAPDAAVIAWAHSVQGLLAEAAAGSDTGACTVLIGGTQSGDANQPASDDLVRALAELVAATPPATESTRTRRVEEGRDVTAAIFGKTFRRKLAQGYPQRYENWSVTNKCRFMGDVYAELLRLPQPQAAQAVRVTEGL